MIPRRPRAPDVAYTSVLDHSWWCGRRPLLLITDHDILGQRFDMDTMPPAPVGPVFPIHFTAYDETAPSVAGIDKLTGIGQYLVCHPERLWREYIHRWSACDRRRALDGSPFYVSSQHRHRTFCSRQPAHSRIPGCLDPQPRSPRPHDLHRGIGGQITQLSGNFPGNPAVSNGPNGDFLIAVDDYRTGFPFDIFGYLWGTRLSLPAIMKN